MTATERGPRARLWTPSLAPVVLGTLLIITCVAFESYAITTALPTVVRDLGGDDWYSAAYAATITTSLVGMVVGGAWADRGRVTTPLAVGGALFVAGVAMCAVAPDMAVFVVGRLVQGLGGGIDSVLVYVVIARFVREAARPAMFGLLSAAWILPSMVGPLAAGALVELLDWRLAFALVAAVSALAVAVLLVVTRRDPTTPVAGRVFDRRTGWAVAAAASILALHVGGPLDGAVGRLLQLAALAVLLAAALALLPRGTLTGRAGVPRFVGLRGLLGATAAGTELYLALYLQSERALTPTTAGLVLATGALGWAAGSWVQSRFGTTRRDDLRVVRFATVVVLAGPAGVLLVVATGAPVALGALAAVVMGIGLGAAYPRAASATLAMTPPAEHGASSSALQVSESMATAAFLALTGTAMAVAAGLGRFLVADGLVVAIAVIAVVTAWRRDPTADRAEPCDVGT